MKKFAWLLLQCAVPSLLLCQQEASQVFQSARPFLTALSVENLAVECQWYEDTFGFRTLKSLDLPGRSSVRVIELNRIALELVSTPGSLSRTSILPDSNDAARLQGFFKFAILVDNIDSVASYLHRRNVRFRGSPVADTSSGFRFFTVEDPEHNLIQIFQRTRP
ncbi:MAG TPA: VOC family protein [Bacteroidota bacterium]|nr:VOC family protein [Bacteroidota bacterium]